MKSSSTAYTPLSDEEFLDKLRKLSVPRKEAILQFLYDFLQYVESELPPLHQVEENDKVLLFDANDTLWGTFTLRGEDGPKWQKAH